MAGLRREAREALAAAGLRPRRRFGQNFLCDGGVVARIIETAELGGAPVVLEIGPGLGALTEALAARARRLYLIEIDRDLGARLAERFVEWPHVRVIVADVLACELDTVVPEHDVTVVANLPYNIATEVIFRLLESRARFPRAVVMLQREVAERLAARPGEEGWGVASVLVQTFATVRLAFGVSRRSFLPQPKVGSAVVDIRWSVAPRVPVADIGQYRAVVRAAFGRRRKMLRNALEPLAPSEQIEAACRVAGVDPRVRAERLDLEAFARLAAALHA